jgi:hypothetical protein
MPMRLPLLLLAALLLAAARAPRAAAQTPDPVVPEHVRARLRVPDSATIQAIALRDGTRLVGRIVAVGEDSVRFVSATAQSSVAITSIVRVTEAPLSSMRPNGEFWFPNPNATRLLFGPTGRMLRQGSGYFSDYLIIFPGGAVGVTDRVTLGGGISLIPATSSQLVYVTPKVGVVQRERVNVAAGALAIIVPDDWGGSTEMLGIAYGVSTFGTPDASFTVGLGYGFQGSDVANDPVAMIGGEVRLSRRVAFVTENYVIPRMREGPLLSYALRFMGEQLALDLGFVNVARGAVFPGMPFVGFVFNVR